MIDHFSGMVVGTPSRSKTSRACAHAFVKDWVCRYGCPERLLSDRGSEFRSDLFDHLTYVFGVKQCFTSGHHAQTNGKLERFRRYLKTCLVADAIGRPWDLLEASGRSPWDAMFPLVMAAYNATPNPQTGYSPFETIYGKPFAYPGDSALKMDFGHRIGHRELPSEHSRTKRKIDHRKYMSDLQKTQKIVRSAVAKLKKEYEDEWSKKRDARRHKSPYYVGQKVLLRVDGLVGNEKKFSQRFAGPFLVKRIYEGQSTLVLTGFYNEKERVVNVTHLKPWYEPT